MKKNIRAGGAAASVMLWLFLILFIACGAASGQWATAALFALVLLGGTIGLVFVAGVCVFMLWLWGVI